MGKGLCCGAVIRASGRTEHSNRSWLRWYLEEAQWKLAGGVSSGVADTLGSTASEHLAVVANEIGWGTATQPLSQLLTV